MSKLTVTVSGSVGSGKSALCGEIEILCRALGLKVEWNEGDQEKNLTDADWVGQLEMYKPEVVISERIEKTDAASLAEVDAARYRFLRDNENWPQCDRYWEALSAGGDNLDRVIDDALSEPSEGEEIDF
jgi:hypothetical protein